MNNLGIPILMPGIRLDTNATNHAPINQTHLVKFEGKRWAFIGGVVDGD